MAFEEYDDFEQEQLVKEWIKNNWFTIVMGIVIGLGSVFGLNYWKTQQQQKRFDMANQYKSFGEVIELAELDEAKKILAEMEAKSDNSFYVIEAHLLLAKEFIKKDDLESAVKQLEAVIAKKTDQLTSEMIKLRLARVYNAMQKYDQALALVSAVSSPSFLSSAKEIEGDAYFAQGDLDKAKLAYQDSVAEGEGYSGKKNIEMKLENT